MLPEGVVDENLEDPALQKKFHEWLQPVKFRRHFLPLLSLICEKIECTFFDDEPTIKKIFDKFSRFKNFEELKRKDKLLNFIPPKVLSNLQNMQSKDLFAKLQKEVKDIISDDDILIETEPLNDKIKVPEEIIEGKVPVIEEVLPLEKNKPIKQNPKFDPKKLKKAEEAFEEKVGKKFFPTEKTINDKDRIEFLENFLEVKESSKDPKK